MSHGRASGTGWGVRPSACIAQHANWQLDNTAATLESLPVLQILVNTLPARPLLCPQQAHHNQPIQAVMK